MTKKCRVLINNDLVTVFKYDDIEVQVPSIGKEADFVNVVKENDRYKVVDDNYVKPEKEKSERHYIKKDEPIKVKKTTKSVKENDSLTEDNSVVEE